MKTILLVFLYLGLFIIFSDCKKEHESPVNHLYVYTINGFLKCRQYTVLKLSGDDTPKKKYEAFSIESNARALHRDDYEVHIHFPDGAEANTYFDGSGKSNNNVSMYVTSLYNTWIPVNGQLLVDDHSREPVPAFFTRGHISFSNLLCIDTSAYPADVIIISGQFTYQ